MANKTRFEFIDALRGIAMLCVILSHAAQIIKIPVLRDLGAMGFRLFFLISSFCIFYTLEQHMREERRPVRNFFIRRFFRIAPLFYCGIVLYTALAGWDGPRWGGGRPEPWHYPMYVFFLCLLHPQTHSTVVPGGWSVSAEAIFYVTLPFLFRWIRGLKAAALFTLFCVTLLPWATWAAIPYVESVIFADLPAAAFRLYWGRFPTVLLGCFSFGILQFYLWRSERVMRAASRPALNVFFILASCLLIAFLALNELWVPARQNLYCLAFMVLALALSARPWPLFVNRFTVFFGKISYSVYILHFLSLTALTRYAGPRVPEISSNPAAAMIVLVAGAALLTAVPAWLSFNFIEKPFIRFGNRIIAKDKKQTSAGPVEKPAPRVSSGGL